MKFGIGIGLRVIRGGSGPAAVPPGIVSVTATSNITTIDADETTTLTANGVTGDSVTLTWYTGPGGTGTNLGTGTTKVVSPGTYYARVTGTGTPAEASITITGIPVYYVANAAAGAGNGTSVANAWGPQTINWATVGTNVLAVCGTINSTVTPITVGIDGCTIKGNSPLAAAGKIDGQSLVGRTSGIVCTGKQGVIIKYLEVVNHISENILIQNNGATPSNVFTYYVNFSGSGNQGIQHLNTSVGTHYYGKGNNCFDEAQSGHESSTINVIGGEYIGDGVNTQAFVNVSATASVTVNITDVWNVGGARYALEGMNGAVFNVTRCRLNKIYTGSTCSYNFTDCYISRSGNALEGDDCLGNITATRTTFDFTNYAPDNGGLDMRSGTTLNLSYCIFKGVQAAKTAVLIRSGVTVANISNCVFYGNPTTPVGIALFSQVNMTVRNCIFRGLSNVGVFAGITYDYCNFTNNTSNGSGTRTNSIVGDPLFTDPANNDFSLQAGSPCFNAGVTVVGYATGIGAGSTWGSASAAPVVVQATQSGTWDIGSYVT